MRRELRNIIGTKNELDDVADVGSTSANENKGKLFLLKNIN